MARHRDQARGLVAVLPLALLLLTAPAPGAAVHSLRTAAVASAADPSDPFGPLVAAAALVAWLLAGWLLLVATTTAGAHVPGLAGRAAAALSRRVAPGAVRRAVEVALGLTVAAGTLAAVAAPAQASGSAGGRPPAAAPALDWPTAPEAASLDWPTPTAVRPAVTAAPPAPGPARPTTVVVAPGDSLWAIAADRLPPSATAAQVAQSWPRWWSANRDAIGADPDLIHPGTRLNPPADPA